MSDKPAGQRRDLKALLAQEAGKLPQPERRAFLANGLTLAGGAMLGSATSAAAAMPNVRVWPG